MRRATRGGQAEHAITVLFLDDESWRCFDQLAAYLRRHGGRPVRLVLRHRRTWLRRLADGLLYAEVIDVSTPAGVERLRVIIASGRVVDAHLSELTLVRLGPDSEVAALAGAAARGGGRDGLAVTDKFIVGEWLRAVGSLVPDQLAADRATTADAVRALGLPLVVKQRVGTAGAQVRVAATVDEADAALAELGADRDAILFERYVDGTCVHYAGVFTTDGPLQEVTVVARKSPANPQGPSVDVVPFDDADLRREGRHIVEVLGATGLVALEFMRDRSGRCWHIDVSTRVWGNVLALADDGVDLFAAYAHVLGLPVDRPLPADPDPGRAHPVQPAALVRAAAAGRRRGMTSQFTAFVRMQGRMLGARYVALTVLELASVTFRRRVGRAGRPPGSRPPDRPADQESGATEPAAPPAGLIAG